MNSTVNILFDALSIFLLACPFPLVSSYIVYTRKPELAQRSRFYRTLFLAFWSCVALDIASIILFIIGLTEGWILMFSRVYVVLLAMPFYYFSTVFWDRKKSSQKEAEVFLLIQSPGLAIGFLFAAWVTRSHQVAIAYTLCKIGVFTSIPGLLLIAPDYF